MERRETGGSPSRGSRKAVVEVGTNSVKYCLAEGTADGTFRILKDVNRIVRLGAELRATGRISGEALARNGEAVASYVTEAREAGAEVVVVGTMALRAAKNAPDFSSLVEGRTGLPVRILTGEEEALLSYEAVLSGIPGAAGTDLLVFDTGGGSTEFVYGAHGRMVRAFSVDVGALRFTERYFPVTPVPGGLLREAREALRSELAEGGVEGPAGMLVGIGGNVTALTSVLHGIAVYDPDKVHGSELLLGDVKRQIGVFASQTLEERRKTVGLPPGREDVILAGACIVEAVMELVGVLKCTVSHRGLRHGLLRRLFAR